MASASNNPTGTTIKKKNFPVLSTNRRTLCRGDIGITPRPGKLLTRDDSFNSTFRTVKANKSRSLESLNYLDVRETSPSDSKYDEVEAAYYEYLTRKFQARLFLDDKEKKEKGCKESLTSFKLEYEALLQKNVALKKDLLKMKAYSESITELDRNIVKAKTFLMALKEAKYGEFLENMVNALDRFVNQLKLVDIKKEELEGAFNNKVLGCDSDIYKTLMKLNDFLENHKSVISDIAQESKEIEMLHDECLGLKQRYEN